MTTADQAETSDQEPKPGLFGRIWAYKWRTMTALVVLGVAGAWIQAQPGAREQRAFNHYLDQGPRHDRIVDATAPTAETGKQVLSYQYAEDRILLCLRDGAIMKTMVVSTDPQRRVVPPKNKPRGTFDACQDIFTLHVKPWMEDELRPQPAVEAPPQEPEAGTP